MAGDHGVEDLPAFGDAEAAGAEGIGHPDGAFGVEGAAVWPLARHLGPHPPVGERAVLRIAKAG